MYQKGEKLVFTDENAGNCILEYQEYTPTPFLQIWYRLPDGSEGALFSWDEFRKARPDEIKVGRRVLNK